jgi:hypothetical protein
MWTRSTRRAVRAPAQSLKPSRSALEDRVKVVSYGPVDLCC